MYTHIFSQTQKLKAGESNALYIHTHTYTCVCTYKQNISYTVYGSRHLSGIGICICAPPFFFFF